MAFVCVREPACAHGPMSRQMETFIINAELNNLFFMKQCECDQSDQNEMGWTFSSRKGTRNVHKIFNWKRKGKEKLKGLSVDGRIMLKPML